MLGGFIFNSKKIVIDNFLQIGENQGFLLYNWCRQIGNCKAVVVVSWSVSLTSTLKILVQIPLASEFF